MLTKTEGIVLHSLKYTDNSIITKIFTREYGLTAFMVKGIHGKKSAFRPAYFQPMTLLEMDIFRQENKSLQRLKELRILQPLPNIQSDMLKGSVAIFMADVLYKTMKEGYVNSPLYELVHQSVTDLENTTVVNALFPIRFLLEISRELGFYPLDNYSAETPVFAITEGRYIPMPERPEPAFHFSSAASIGMHRVLQGDEILPADQRSMLLHELLQYYQYHTGSSGRIQSHQVLHQLFH